MRKIIVREEKMNDFNLTRLPRSFQSLAMTRRRARRIEIASPLTGLAMTI
ncbi:MAG: hypothetical protein U9O50_09155 [Acidobacteriota bacterium]|nr:hypothetical protein [Acidobacteriota bacterium]